MKINCYVLCECGAITVYCDDGTEYSCKKENFKKFFSDVDLSEIEQLQPYCNCNHCVNHYGLDLCGCGSGEEYGHCDNHFNECSIPMQVVGKYQHVRANDAWLR